MQCLGFTFEIIFIKLATGKFATATNNQVMLAGIGSIVFVALLLIAVFGACGAYNRNMPILSIYSFIMTCLFVSSWVVFVYMKGGKYTIHSDFEDYCNIGKIQGLIVELDKAYPKSLGSYCCSLECPCKANEENFPLTADYLSAKFKEGTGATTVLNCPKKPFTGSVPKIAVLSFLGEIEDKFSCSGICNKEKWYYYSNVNRGPPQSRCLEDFLYYVDGTLTILQHKIFFEQMLTIIHRLVFRHLWNHNIDSNHHIFCQCSLNSIRRLLEQIIQNLSCNTPIDISAQRRNA